jgi:glutaminyl-tRNA synthetase
MYDYAHPLSDAIEGITHSTCGKEFANHRPLYDWFLEKLEIKEPPRQIEFAEIGISGIVLGKRHLKKLVQGKIVSGWDDPRMPTIRGLRRRGCPQAAIWQFCRELGVSNASPGEVHVDRLEHAMREVLNKTSPRVMGVLHPIKVVIENYPDEKVEHFEVIKNPERPEDGTFSRPFSKEIYIDRDDFLEDPPKKYHRMSPGREVRLRYAYLITCTGVVKDPKTGEITELRASYDPASRGGEAPDGRKVPGTLHWVSAKHALKAEVRLYDSLFTPEVENFDKGGEEPIEKFINPNSLEVLRDAYVEPAMKNAAPGERVQFERVGYFAVDPDSTPDKLVFNRTVELRDKKFSKIFQK